MTKKEAKQWLQMAARVQQEFGCAVMFVCDDDGKEQLEAMAGAQKKLAADTDGGNEY